MTRFWVSWWSGYYESEGCTKPPIQIWISGERDRADDKTELSICAVIDAESEKSIWRNICKYFPDYIPRFCEPKSADYVPGDRFPGFEYKTTF